MAKPAPKIVARNFTEAHAFAREVLKLSKGKYRVASSSAALFGSTGDVHLVPGWSKRSDRFAIQNKLRFTRLNVIDHEADEENSGEDQSDLTSNGDNMLSEGAPVFTIFSDPEAWLKATDDSLKPIEVSVEATDDFTPVAEVTEDQLQAIDEQIESDQRTPEEIEATEAEADRNAAEARADLEVHDVDTRHTPEEWQEKLREQEEWQQTHPKADDNPEEDERPLNGRRRRRCKDCGELIHPDDVDEHAAEEEKKRERLS